MISIPFLSSSLLLLALVFLSVEGRSTAPWQRRHGHGHSHFPLFGRSVFSQGTNTKANPNLGILRGGDSGLGGTPPGAHSALPTPAAARIHAVVGGASASASSSSSASSSGTSTSTSSAAEMALAGGHIKTKAKGAPASPEATAATSVSATSGGAQVAAIDDFVSKEEKKVQKRKDKEERIEKKKEIKQHKKIAKKLKNRNATNKRRKFLHFSWGMLFASCNHFIPRRIFLPGMTFFTGLNLTVELLRYRKGFEWMNNLLHFFLGKALRKNEMDGKFTGGMYYFGGVTITAFLFPKSCATLGICQLAIADPTASFFGRATRHVYWSRINNGFFGLGRNKGILGFLGGAICCVPLNYRLLSLAVVKNTAGPIAKPTVLAISLALGLAGALADLMVPTPALTLPKTVCGVRVPPFHLDDNIAIPILSGWACTRILGLASIGPTDLVLSKYLVL